MQAAGATDLVLFSTLEILVVVQVDQLAFGAVDDVCDCKSVEHDLMMVAMVVREEDAQAFFIVSGGEAFGISEVISGPLILVGIPPLGIAGDMTRCQI